MNAETIENMAKAIERLEAEKAALSDSLASLVGENYVGLSIRLGGFPRTQAKASRMVCYN
jgi:hypothetical protein